MKYVINTSDAEALAKLMAEAQYYGKVGMLHTETGIAEVYIVVRDNVPFIVFVRHHAIREERRGGEKSEA